MAYKVNNKGKRKRDSKKYYKLHKEEMKKSARKYRETHKEEIRKAEAKYRKIHRKRISSKNTIYLKKSKGITPKSKCINGCKASWYILERHHLTKTQSVIFCPNCHAIYHWKLGKKKSLKRG